MTLDTRFGGMVPTAFGECGGEGGTLGIVKSRERKLVLI